MREMVICNRYAHNSMYIIDIQMIKIMRKVVNDRIIEVIEALNLSEYAFAKKLGYASNSTIQRITTAGPDGKRASPGYETLMTIIDTFGVNPTWLMTGVGDMFGTIEGVRTRGNTEKIITVTPSGGSSIVLVDQKAAAGYAQGIRDVDYVDRLPAFNLPGFTNATFRAFEIEGDSMEPTLWQGDWIICTQLESIDQVREGYVHVVVMQDGSIVAKRAVRNEKGLILKSDNRAYTPYTVDLEDVFEIWKGVARITRYMSAPQNLDVRLTTLEANFNELAKQVSQSLRKKT